MYTRIIRIRAALPALAFVSLLAGCGGGGGYGGGSSATNPQPAAPTIALTAPAATVNRTATLTATVTASSAVTSVEFLVDGAVVGTSTAAPYTFEWDTSAAADGAHSLTGRVTDSTNTVATSAPVNVTVNNNPVIAVVLTPNETFPLPTSTASGEGELTFNLVSGAVSGGVTVSGLTATLAHIHRAFAGAAGPVIVDFVQDSATPGRWGPQSGSLLTAEEVDDLLAGRLYVNVHSAAYPQGEIRGQLKPENIAVVITSLNGQSVSPPTATTAIGMAGTTIDARASTATVHLNTSGVDDASEAHVHKAAAGSNATAALITLTRDAASASHWLAELQTITAADRTDFDADGWYVDVHTPANPAGAIRGQIAPSGATQPTAATLTQLQSTVFSPRCAVCHNGSGSALPGSMNLSSAAASFAALVSVPSVEQSSVLRVAPNDPGASYLVRKLEGAAGITGERMPLGGPFLDQATIDQVRSWIAAGAQNN
jgi:hypothetical protein